MLAADVWEVVRSAETTRLVIHIVLVRPNDRDELLFELNETAPVRLNV